MGGSQIFTYNLIKYLSLNHTVHLYLPYRAYLKAKKLNIIENVNIYPIFYYEYFLANNFRYILNARLKYFQKKNKYDVWQVIGAYPAGWITKDLSSIVPISLRSHGDDIQKNNILDYGVGRNIKIDKRIKISLSKMNSLVALTNTVSLCYKSYNIKEEKICEIPNGVQLKRFKKKIDKKNIRMRYGIKDNELFILTVGRYHLKKGYELIPDVCSKLNDKNINYKWLIVGTDTSKIEPLVNKKKMSKNIKLIYDPQIIGVKKDFVNVPPEPIVDLYLSADLFIMPSMLETFGMVLIEAMAAGLPIITTNAPGCRDVVKNSYNGLLVEPGDSNQIFNAIVKIIFDTELREVLIKGSRMFVNDYDWSIIAKKYENLFLKMINK